MPVYRGPGGAGDATNDATVTAVQAAATSAATSATNAANSATAAATSASGASTSATNASNSATSSAGSATSSANSATTSAGYATNSSLSADDSAASAVEAAGYASDAFDYSVAASVSSGTASDYADSAIAASASAYAHELAAEAVLTDPDFITVLGISADIDALSPIAADISTVAGIAADVTAVAGNATDISAVADNLVDIGVVAENEADIDTVSGISANVTTVAGISANVTTVAGIDSDVTTVATNNANVTTVATNIASVNTVAGNTSNINQVASDTVVINSASANATAAAASALSASGSATSASASAAAASAVALGNEPVRHSVRPSLLLDFANTKTLDPRITFSRASTGTYYDGKTTVKAEQNLLPKSQEFEGFALTRATVTVNSTTAPDGTTTADSLLQQTGQTVFGNCAQSISVNAGACSLSCFVKPNGKNFVVFQEFLFDGTLRRTWFDVQNGTVGTTDANHTASIVASTNGFYRCVITLTANAARTTQINFGVADTNGSITVTDTGGLFLWGAQLEQRSSVTAYTATTTAPITNYIPALQTATSGTARFDHNPTTGESLGLLIEEQRTNLLTYSEQFDNAAWSKLNTTISANAIIAPDGTLTGDKLVANSGSSIKYTDRAVTVAASTTHTFSAYMKAGEYTTATIYAIAPSAPFENFSADVNLTTGAVSNIAAAGGATVITATATSVGNGWYRVAITGGVAAKTTMNTRIYLNSSTAFTGNGYSGIYIWGAQLEAGAFATSYIPTVASQVTRSADSASMTGTNFSSWYRQDEGSVYVEALADNYAIAGAQIRTFAMLSNDAQTTFYYFGRGSTTAIRFVSNINGAFPSATPSSAIANGTITVGQSDKFVFGYSSAIPSLVLDGTKFTDITSSYTQARELTTLTIGGTVAGLAANNLNGSIKKLAYYPKRLLNEELVSLTTI